MPKRCHHCLVWGTAGDVVARGCAHCQHVEEQVVFTEDNRDRVERYVQISVDLHAERCVRA